MKNNIGHNKPPKEIRLTDGEIIILDKQGRINLKNSIIKKLPRSVNEKGDYIVKDYNDSERVGLKVRVNRGGSKTIWFRWYNKNIKNSGTCSISLVSLLRKRSTSRDRLWAPKN